MRHLKNKSGFTLLEIIIVVIIIGVLASLALPRFFRTVEYSKSTEALSTMGTVRQAMQRCYAQTGSISANCTTLASLDVDDPNSGAGRRFNYAVNVSTVNTFSLVATRTTADAGSGLATDFIRLNVLADGSVTKSGGGIYIGIK